MAFNENSFGSVRERPASAGVPDAALATGARRAYSSLARYAEADGVSPAADSSAADSSVTDSSDTGSARDPAPAATDPQTQGQAQGQTQGAAAARELREATPASKSRFARLSSRAPGSVAAGAVDPAGTGTGSVAVAVAVAGAAAEGEAKTKVEQAAVTVKARKVRFAALATFAGSQTPQSDEVKGVMHAVRSLARLISAIAYRPGSQALAAEKTATLEALVLRTRTFADRVMARLEATDRGSRRLPRWVRPALQEVAAVALAEQWEAGREADAEPLVEMTEAFIELASSGIALSLDEFAEHVYQPASEPDIAAARLLVSTNKAAFVLADGFFHAGVRGETAMQHLERLTRSMLSEVRESPLTAMVPDDLKVAHTQAMLGRLAELTAWEIRAVAAHAGSGSREARVTEIDTAVVEGCWARARHAYRLIETMAIDAYREKPTQDEPREKAA